jgi:rRNA maturation protein Rpf1
VIGLTTSRQTTQRMNSLLNELSHALPHAKIIRRGKANLNDLSIRLLNENITHAIVLNRWHGSPGRITLYAVNPKGIANLTPSMLLSEVKLKREYGTATRCVVQGISCGPLKDSTRRFSQILASTMELPLAQDTSSMDATFHLLEANGSIRLVVTSPPTVREVGPSLTISRLLWKSG